MEFIKKNRAYIMWAGCALIAIAVFLPFVKISMLGFTETVKFKDITDNGNEFKAITGWLVVIAALASAALIYLKKDKYSLIATGTAFLITFYDLFKVKDELKDAAKIANVSYTAPWIVLVGVILAAGPIIIDILEEKNIIKTK